MRVIAHDPFATSAPTGVELRPLAEVIAESDVLSLHCPLTPETRGILNARTFGKLARDGKLSGPVVINAGRGGLQNEDDLLAALNDGTNAEWKRIEKIAAGQGLLEGTTGRPRVTITVDHGNALK